MTDHSFPTAAALAARYSMRPHEENGSFAECHYPHEGTSRAASGAIFYYVAPGERTSFHRIDCDEYWCWHAGSPLEVWQIDAAGKLTVTRLGTQKSCSPLLFLPAGTVFASRLGVSSADGTFLSCITVPRFSYDGFFLLTPEQILSLCPDAARFWN